MKLKNMEIVINDQGNMLDVKITRNGVPHADWGTADPVEAAAFILWELFGQHDIYPPPWDEIKEFFMKQYENNNPEDGPGDLHDDAF